ncbi:MAG: hypothetical protein OQJ78_05815 [Ignavibacteriaceae bacterium]|nr:hypothetical protein [Ignavibacteriaceae bacterium]
MRYGLIKGLWDKWKKIDIQSNVNDLMQYFKELEKYLSTTFTGRISLRENIFCVFLENENPTPNVNITIPNFLTHPVDGIMVMESSEPGNLTWFTAGPDLTFRFTTTSPSIAKLKLAIFYRE